MGVIITPDNWKDYRKSEAERLFPIDSLVQYTRGFTRFDDDNFGKVSRITGAGIVYAHMVELKEVRRKGGQEGGWREFDSRKVTELEEMLRFVPKLYDIQIYVDKKWVTSYSIGWRSVKETKDINANFHNIGNFKLRPAEIGKNGIIRASFDSCL